MRKLGRSRIPEPDGSPTRPNGERSRTPLGFLLLFNLNLVPLVVSWPLLQFIYKIKRRAQLEVKKN